MNTNTSNPIFEPQILAEDLLEIHRIYARFFDTLDETSWDKPVKGGPKEWTLHETIAHLYALNNAGLESIQYALRGEPYTFIGLDNRYELNAYNRKGIKEYQGLPMRVLFTKLLNMLDEAAAIARTLQPGQAELTAQMSIYNRPVKIVEALSIIIFHIGLAHSAQVAEPAGLLPLWRQLSTGFLHRVIGRVMAAFSLLYRFDIGGSLRDAIVFQVEGPGGGQWYVDLSPEHATSGEGMVEHPGLVIHMRDTSVFCRMVTSRLNLPIALINGNMQLRGDLRLFLHMGTLFSVDARPKAVAKEKTSTSKHLAGKLSPNK
jgi:hypothetical protein